jgi:hypothetical protein
MHPASFGSGRLDDAGETAGIVDDPSPLRAIARARCGYLEIDGARSRVRTGIWERFLPSCGEDACAKPFGRASRQAFWFGACGVFTEASYAVSDLP